MIESRNLWSEPVWCILRPDGINKKLVECYVGEWNQHWFTVCPLDEELWGSYEVTTIYETRIEAKKTMK